MADDNVNHPSHYNQYSGFEVIDVCEQLVGPDGKAGFNLGNAFKYIARAGWKNPDKHVEDLEKAKFYIQREIARIQKPQPGDPFAAPEHLRLCGVCRHCLKKAEDDSDMYFCTTNKCVMQYVRTTEYAPDYNPTLKDDTLRQLAVIDATYAKKFDDIKNSLRPLCATCDFEMRLSAKQSNDGTQYFECEAGHGSVRLPVPPNPKTFVMNDKVSSLAFPEAYLRNPTTSNDLATGCGVDKCVDHPATKTVAPQIEAI